MYYRSTDLRLSDSTRFLGGSMQQGGELMRIDSLPTPHENIIGSKAKHAVFLSSHLVA